MKLIKPVISSTLVAVIALSGCSSKDSDGTGTTTTTTPAPSASSAPSPAENKNKEKLTLSWFLEAPATADLPKGGEDFVMKAIQEKFNVELKMNYMPGGAERKSKLAVMIASGETPDLFTSTGLDSNEYLKQGVAGDISKAVTPEKMPNYFKWVTMDELKRFQIPGSYVRVPRPVDPNPHAAFFIRKDWLDKLKLQPPKTYDELTNVLRAFSKNDPDGNGKNDTYGFSHAGNGANVFAQWPQYKKNGLVGGSFVDKEGNYRDTYSDPKTGAVLDDIRAWINEGIVDPDWYTSSNAKMEEKFSQGKIGMIWASPKTSMLESNPSSLISRLKQLQPEAQMIPIHPFPDTANWVENIMTNLFLISKTTADKEPQKVDRIMQIIDWLSSEEGFLMTHYGLEGKHYTKEGNKVTLKPDAIKADILDKGNFLTIWGFMTPDYPEKIKLEVIDPRITDKERETIKTVMSYPLAQGFGTTVVPPPGVNLADFRKPLYETHAKILFDEKDSSNWPKYREELLTKYKGREIFEAYVQQMKAAGVKVNDFK